MLHYLPGCDVERNHPEAVYKLKKYMEKQGAIIDHCCRVKYKYLEDEDIIINNCTLCTLVLNETYPNNECLSLYEYILKDQSFPWINHHCEMITVQDCWRTKDNFALQQAVRECLQKMNYTIVEMEENYSKTKYCGVWLNSYPAKDCIDVAPNTFHDIIENYIHLLTEEEKVQSMKLWVERYTTDKILVYCNGCEKGIKLCGKQVSHMIELLAEGLI